MTAAQPVRPQLRRMLEARSVAVVGASDRPGSLGLRMAQEATRSAGPTGVHLVNPRRDSVLGRPCLPSLADVPGPVDLVMLGTPDSELPDQLRLAAGRGDGGAVVFGGAHGLRDEIVAAAGDLAVCGAGCMGFVNTTADVRALGYLERDPVPAGPVALVTHSGSVFSALLRTHRRLGFTLAVSSGQELVTTTADYLHYALSRHETGVVGLVLETMRDAPRLRAALAEAAARDVPVVALTLGSSVTGQALVDTHSGALAGSDAAWEALFDRYGVHRCEDLAELVDSLETFAIGRRVVRRTGGIATAHDSGAERVLVADVADRLGVPFAALSPVTVDRLGALLDPGLAPANPLDVWGSGRDTDGLFHGCLSALADDPAVDVVALAVDLVPEYDGDDSYPRAVQRLLGGTDKPVVVLSNLSSAIDQAAAGELRSQGVPVLEGTRSGLRALGHLLAQADPRLDTPSDLDVDVERQRRWVDRFVGGDVDPWRLLADYGVPVIGSERVRSAHDAVAAAQRLGHPVVLKTARADVHHKVDVDGVRLGLVDPEAVRAAYDDLAARLGPDVEVQQQASPGVELALGVVRDPLLGPLVLVAAGGSLVELLDQRAVALPPLRPEDARRMLESLRVADLLRGHRGGPARDVDAVVSAMVGLARLGHELGDHLEALDVNPLVVGERGAVAVDVLLLPRSG